MYQVSSIKNGEKSPLHALILGKGQQVFMQATTDGLSSLRFSPGKKINEEYTEQKLTKDKKLNKQYKKAIKI